MREGNPETQEHRRITAALHVEQLERNLFRSTKNSVPHGARGVFGGEVISQALVCATKCVDPAFGLHSMHCYFLLSASAEVPIVYFVDRLREGRSYITRSVNAIQNGKSIFFMMCSFQKPEPLQPTAQWRMPSNVPPPDNCESAEDTLERFAEKSHDIEVKAYYKTLAQERRLHPIDLKTVTPRFSANGYPAYLSWMKAKDMADHPPSFQKCILAYMSDLNLINVAVRTLGLSREKSMNTSLDHSIYYYDNDFDCAEWILYVMMMPRAGSGRAVLHGRLYTQTGRLIATTSQEGLVRAPVSSLGDAGTTEKPKL